MNLPVTDLVELKIGNHNSWNIVKVGFGKENTRQQVIKEEEEDEPKLQVFYPKNSICPSMAPEYPQGGIGFYASPIGVFPAKELIFEYEIYLDDSFKPQKGGKLPGVYISKPGVENINGASGGNRNTLNSSCRIMWRKDYMAEAYVYTPTRRQHSEYYRIQNQVLNSTYGDSLWRGLFKLKKGQWNKIKMHIKMNSVPSSSHPNTDGLLVIKINEIEKRFTKMVWRNDPKVMCSALFIDTFYGGSDESYKCPNDTYIYFRRFFLDPWKFKTLF
jgi:hypothetical protein